MEKQKTQLLNKIFRSSVHSLFRDLLTLLCLSVFYPIFAQDRVDPRPLDSSLFSDTSIYDKDFHKRHFIRGWNFGGATKKLDSSLRINYYLFGSLIDTLTSWGLLPNYINGHRRAYNPYEIFNNRKASINFNGHSLYLKPYITVDTNNYFEPKPDEGTGAVFGFLNKAIGDTATEVVDSNVFRTFQLNRNRITPGNPQVVLSNPWRNDALRYLNHEGMVSKVYSNGKIWYLTINLRSRDTTILPHKMDSTVLTIRVRYKTNQSNNIVKDSIMFWKFPEGELKRIISSRGDYLGLTRELGDSNETTIKEWKIKAKHLATDSNRVAGKFITLSAEFHNCGPKDNTVHPNRRNPIFEPDGKHQTIDTFITSIDLVVIYHGHLNISINYIRLETPQAQKIFRGAFDEWLRTEIARMNDTIKKYNRCDMRIHRFYTQDEPIPSEWATTRYVNKLLNGLGVVETSPQWQDKYYFNKFIKATGFDLIWLGNTLAYGFSTPAPYIRNGKFLVGTNTKGEWDGERHPCVNFLGLENGYKGRYHTVYGCNFDTSKNVNTGISNLQEIADTINSGGLDMKHLSPTFPTMLNIMKSYEGFLFDTVFWYAYLWSTSHCWDTVATERFVWPGRFNCFGQDTVVYNKTYNPYMFKIGRVRPHSGEELRQMMWFPVLLGAKGLFHFDNVGEYGTTIKNGDTITYVTSLGFVNSNHPNFMATWPEGDSLIYWDKIGGDYINLNDTIPYNWRRNYDFSSIAYDSLGIDNNHIYIGCKSARAELAKFNKWAEATEDTLLKLRLSALFLRYKHKKDSTCFNFYYYAQSPRYSDTLLKTFVKIHDVKTRRLDQQNYEPDSLKFVLLTLFAYGNDTLRTTEQTFYLGVLNPRTDPLVRTYDTVWYYPKPPELPYILFIDSSMKFYSTAEYDIGVRYGNYTHIWNSKTNSYEWRDSTYWQSLWWQRQGCREIRIPLNIPWQYPTACDDGVGDYVVKVEELGASDANLNKEFWRQPKYYHKVDTTLYGFVGNGIWYIPYYRDYSLKVRLLPGEGKILKIRVFRRNIPSIAGIIKITNQTKIITHPIGYAQQWRRDSIFHHIVYHRKDTFTGRSRVFYRRSIPLFPDTSVITKIIWSPEICLSDSIRCWYEPERIVTNGDCAYPSVVVRYDSVSERTKVYVAFVCRDTDSLSNFNDCMFSNTPRENCPNNDYTVVAECVFNADDTIPTIPVAQAIRWACGSDYSVWGTPVVNASRKGNYYVWADSIAGIVAGYKRPWQNEFPLGFNFIMSSFKFNPNGIVTNPSVTSYS